MSTAQMYAGKEDYVSPTSQTVNPDHQRPKADFLTEDLSQFFSPGTNGQASSALQDVISMALVELEENFIFKTLKDETANPLMRSHAQAVGGLISRWFSAGPWSLSHEVAIEQLKAVLITQYFVTQLTSQTPELLLPEGLSIDQQVDQYRLKEREVRTAVRYQIQSERMAPQLTPGTKVLLVKRDGQKWSKKGDVVYVERIMLLGMEITGRIVESGKQTIRLQPDNASFPTMVIRRKDIRALYSITYIKGKKVL